MADQTSPESSNDQGKRKRGAVGVFPRLPLAETLDLPRTIFALGEGEPVRRRTVFDKLGKSPDSGSSRTLIVASNSGYGLTTGSYSTEYLGLTERGTQIAAAKDEASKYEAFYEALFGNDIFSAFVTRFNDRSIPLDEIAIEYLKNTHSLGDADAKVCWSTFKENLAGFGLVQELSGKRVIISRETALESIGRSQKQSSSVSSDQANDSRPLDITPTDTPDPAAKMTVDLKRIVPQFHFNIQIVLPENAPSETYDNIFRSIATHLLGRNED